MTFLATKDPQDVISWDIDWHLWLPSGETISVSDWSITGTESPIALIEDSSTIRDYQEYDESQSPRVLVATISNTVARVTCSAGTVGQTYLLVNHITTSESQEFDRTITVTIRNR